MTSLEVIDTDVFLDMPVSSQLLYFHLNARADDDGFVANPKKVTRMINAGDDDLKLLIVKKFLIAFADGVCVIKHWRINNFVRKDIYKETKYLDHKNTLFIRSNGAYTQSDDGRAIPLPKGHFTLESVDDTLTQRQLRLGKGSIGKSTDFPSENGLSSGKEEIRIVPDEEKEKVARPKADPRVREIAEKYMKRKGLVFKNDAHITRDLARNMKAAKHLLDFTGAEILKCFEFCEEKFGDMWTLETVVKQMSSAQKK